MAKQRITLNDFSGGLNTYQYPRDLQINELQRCENLAFKRGMSVTTSGSMTTHGEVGTQAATIAGGYGLFSFESDYSPVGYEAVDTSQSTNIVFQDNTGASGFSAVAASVGLFIDAGSGVASSHTNSGLKDGIISNVVPGTQIAIKGTQKNNGIYTVAGVADSATGDIWPVGLSNAIEIQIPASGEKFADETIAANSSTYGAVSITTHSIGESVLVLSDVNNGNLDVYSKSTDAFVSGAITTKTGQTIRAS